MQTEAEELEAMRDRIRERAAEIEADRDTQERIRSERLAARGGVAEWCDAPMGVNGHHRNHPEEGKYYLAYDRVLCLRHLREIDKAHLDAFKQGIR